MAVKYVKQENNLLGGLGSMAQLGGLATGAGWLTTLGTGLKGLQKQMNGKDDNDDGTGALSQILEGINGGWKVLTDNNIGKVKTNEQTDDEQALNPGWWTYGNTYNPYVGGGLGTWGVW